jgi:hypothetical protein
VHHLQRPDPPPQAPEPAANKCFSFTQPLGASINANMFVGVASVDPDAADSSTTPAIVEPYFILLKMQLRTCTPSKDHIQCSKCV